MANPKNVLVLMCDHQRFDALGCLGNPLAHTPNLDRLAARSVRFANCYNQAPVCAPARHSLATGRYCHAHGVLTNRHKPYPGMRTVAHALQPLGYLRFQLGHMHWTDRTVDTGYEPWIDQHMWRETMPREALDRYEWESQNITRRTTGGPSTRTRVQYWGYHVATNAVRLIESAVERREPFLCWAAFTEPHPSFYPPKELYTLVDQSAIRLPEQPPPDAPPPHREILRRRQEWAHLTQVELRQIIAGYYGMIALVDGYCGMVLDALDRLGTRDDTVDLFPTICELVGASIPDTVQGRSLVPLLGEDRAPDGWRDAVFSQIGDVQMIRTEQFKLNVYGGQPGELFELRNDPREFYNRIADPAYADTIQSLFDRLKAWEEANR